MASSKISKRLKAILLDQKRYPIPSPFCIDKKKVKAIILGCDPSNFSDKDRPKILRTVFGIGTGDHRYFRDVLKNLKQVGLNLENIYVQNVIPYYMNKETTQNPDWNEIAKLMLPDLINELDDFDKRRKIPVFMTSQVIYKFLLKNGKDYCKPKDLYNIADYLPIKKDLNKLGRNLYPLYRHFHYSLSTNRFDNYKNLLRKNLNI